MFFLDTCTPWNVAKNAKNILKRNVPTAELVAIGDWATEEMARRYIERLSLFAPGGRNYSDVALGTVAVDGCKNAVAAIVQPRNGGRGRKRRSAYHTRRR